MPTRRPCDCSKQQLPDLIGGIQGDLIVDTFGAAIGAVSGYFYLNGIRLAGLGRALDEFIKLNRRLYGKMRRK